MWREKTISPVIRYTSDGKSVCLHPSNNENNYTGFRLSRSVYPRRYSIDKHSANEITVKPPNLHVYRIIDIIINSHLCPLVPVTD